MLPRARPQDDIFEVLRVHGGHVKTTLPDLLVRPPTPGTGIDGLYRKVQGRRDET